MPSTNKSLWFAALLCSGLIACNQPTKSGDGRKANNNPGKSENGKPATPNDDPPPPPGEDDPDPARPQGITGGLTVQPITAGRADVGQPLSQEELRAGTQRYIDLLKATRYFHFIRERAHGWPKEAGNGYWFTQWWEYVWSEKTGERIRFDHVAGSDNPNMSTGKIMEGSCFAYRLFDRAAVRDQSPGMQSVQGLVRGFNAWILAGQRRADPNNTPILQRTLYTKPVEFDRGGQKVFLDYSKMPGGPSQQVSQTVHLTDNPHWSEIWVKNRRSKDDVGHMMRSLGNTMATCTGTLSADGEKDLKETTDNYARLGQQIVADGFGFRSYETNRNVTVQSPYLPDVLVVKPECNGRAMWSLIAKGDPAADCGNGIQVSDALAARNHMNRRLLESHHAAAVIWARIRGQQEFAQRLLEGLGQRLTTTMNALANGRSDAGFTPLKFSEAMIEASNAGVQLTSREIRWLHGQIDKAFEDMTAKDYRADFFTALLSGQPDGRWQFTPGSVNIEFPTMGSLIGACTSQLRHPAARPVFDCEMLKAAAADFY